MLRTYPKDLPALDIANDMVVKLGWRITEAKERLTKWATEELAVNPAYAFEYADQRLKDAAEIVVLQTVQAAILHTVENIETENGTKLWDAATSLISEATKRALSLALRPPRSTSPMSNMMEQEVAARWAQIADPHNMDRCGNYLRQLAACIF